MKSSVQWISLLPLILLARLSSSDPYDNPNTQSNRQTIVHLFEWRWSDIATECETFLQYNGYGAVQVSPPQEHIVLTTQNGNNRPWWIRYQPVSYQLNSRSGTRAEFIDMVNRCNNVGIRIIVDAVINHMVGLGYSSSQNGISSSGSCTFQGFNGAESFPCVPYSAGDFNDPYCQHNITNWNDPNEVRECRLSWLLDLNQGEQDVRNAISAYFNDVISIGVAGVRVDAAKSVWPQDLQAIYSATSNVQSSIYGPNQRMFVVQEVPDGGAVTASQYTPNGRVTNFDYGTTVAGAVTRTNNFKYYGALGPSWFNNLADNDALNFIDNHDTQRSGYPLTYQNGDQYIMAVTFMLAWTYGYPRVMSSFYFSLSNTDQGPPSTGAPNFQTTGPSFNPDGTCAQSSGWVCEHRWPAIRHMVQFRSLTTGLPASDIVTQDHCIAFSRGNQGFFALNNGYSIWTNTFQTGLPAGIYCDIISGYVSGSSCTGASVYVNSGGFAGISIPSGKTFAIHSQSRLNIPVTPPPVPTPASGWQLTVVFMYMVTEPTQNMFLRGGIGASRIPNCPTNNNNLASDPCAIRIEHATTVPSSYVTYTSWSQGDNYLDWNGAEPGQGQYAGIAASGTPLAWSTNDPNNIGFQRLNTFGPNYWMVQMYMNCAQTVNGWFELKGYEQGPGAVGWESDVSQVSACSGTTGGSPPYTSGNHFARCGYLNVFQFNSGSCIIGSLN